MSEDKSVQLFKYMTEQFAEVHASLDEAREEFRHGVDRINNRLDVLYGKIDIDDTERLVLGHKVDRHTERIARAAQKIDLKYHPGS